MKFMRLGDTHLGVRQGSDIFLNFQIEYLRNNVFEYCRKNNIGRIYQHGDLFDVRKFVFVNAMTQFRNLLNEYKDIEFVWAPGNHDQTTKNDLSLSAGYFMADMCNNFIAHRNINTETIDGKKITLVPWLCKENQADWDKLKNVGSDLVMGHFEIQTFPFYQGVECTHGLLIDDFKNFSQVSSGHFHTRSRSQNVSYLGSPYHLTWSDFKDGTNRGFDIFDTETMKSNQINNDASDSLFVHIRYNDGYSGDVSDFENKIVHLTVDSKENLKSFTEFSELVNHKSIDFKVEDNTIKAMKAVENTEEFSLKDRSTQIREFVNQQDIENKEKVIECIFNLYSEVTSDNQKG